MKSSVLIIYTGGTIGMKTNEETGALAPFDFAQISEEVPELKKITANIDTVTFSPLLDSSDIAPENWIQMAEVIKKEYDKYDGFVILHGTDTMAYSASALSYMLENLSKPIIFTGSQIPIGVLRTDGKENLMTSVEIAAAKRDGKAIVPEVCIYFQNKLLRGNRTRKYSADYLAAFRSENYPCLADIGIEIHYNYPYIKEVKDSRLPLLINTKFSSDIVVVTIFPGITRNVLSSMLNIDGLKGVILRTYGAGNAPTKSWFLEEIENCIKKGVVVMNVTQCNSGTVQMDVYDTGKQLSSIGVLSGADMTSEAAITKLMIALGKGLSQEELAVVMGKPISGEVTIKNLKH